MFADLLEQEKLYERVKHRHWVIEQKGQSSYYKVARCECGVSLRAIPPEVSAAELDNELVLHQWRVELDGLL